MSRLVFVEGCSSKRFNLLHYFFFSLKVSLTENHHGNTEISSITTPTPPLSIHLGTLEAPTNYP